VSFVVSFVYKILFQDAGLSTRKQHTVEIILQIPSLLCPTSHYMYEVIDTEGGKRGPGWLNELGSWITQQLIKAYHQYGVGSRPALYITEKGALDSQPKVIKFTSCLSMVGGSLRLLPPLKLVAMI
jgi:hypothetical protein